MMPRQFPRLILQTDGHKHVVAGNRVGLMNMEWLSKVALDGPFGACDAYGQSQSIFREGDNTIITTVRSLDIFETLPPCKSCAGKSHPEHCPACGGSGREMPEDCKNGLPFL